MFQALTIISNIFGYSQLAIWMIGMSLCVIECFRKKTSSGVAKDYIALLMMGFCCMAIQDQFGFWNPKSSYSSEIHISDQIISFIGCLFSSVMMVIVFGMPQSEGKEKNVYTWMTYAPISICLVAIVIYSIYIQDLDNICIAFGQVKSILSIIAYFPQFYRIYLNKSTHGWSMLTVATDTTGSSIGMIQVIIDYFNNDYGLGFWSSLNYGKFALNFFSFGCSCVFYFQHFVLYNPYRQKKGFKNIDFDKAKDAGSFSTEVTIESKTKIIS